MADRLQKEIVNYVVFLDPEFPEPEFAPHPDATPSLAAQTTGWATVNARSARGSVAAVMHGFADPERSGPSTRWRTNHLDRHGHRLRGNPHLPVQRRTRRRCLPGGARLQSH